MGGHRRGNRSPARSTVTGEVAVLTTFVVAPAFTVAV